MREETLAKLVRVGTKAVVIGLEASACFNFGGYLFLGYPAEYTAVAAGSLAVITIGGTTLCGLTRGWKESARRAQG